MRALLLGAGVAALALAGPALSQSKGGGNGGGGPKAERGGGGKGERGGGSHKAGGGGGHKAERGNGGRGQQARGERGSKQARRGPDRREAKAERRAERAERIRGPERRQAKAERRDAKAERLRGPERRAARADNRKFQREVRAEHDGRRDRDRAVAQVTRAGDRWRNNYPATYAGNDRGLAYGDGCPPGLAAKGNGCLPPGQARKLVGQRAPQVLLTSLLPAAYRSWYPDTSDYYYRTQDDTMYRIDRSSNDVLGYAPLYGFGSDYAPDYYYAGEQYPLDYVSYDNVPTQYQDYYQDEGDWLYRYGDGGIYRVNGSNGLVDSVVALLAGDLAMGQPLPAGYDVYNVPSQYRDRYADTADEWYRYNDGYIYQVDPKTQLITAVIQALV